MYIINTLTSWNWDSYNVLVLIAVFAAVYVAGRMSGKRSRARLVGPVLAIAAFSSYFVWFLMFDWA